MKKSWIVLLAGVTLFALMAGTAMAAAPFHIGVVTLTVSQAEDTYRGAERLTKEYGDVAKGGYIKHITLPDNFMSEMETSISQIAGLADDPKMKVIVVDDAVPGTTEGFRRVKEKRPDILCFAGEPQEDPNVITSVADLAIGVDNVLRGYLIIDTAKKMGADTFVHISFPRHMSYELLSRRRNIMEQACKDLGMKFVFETAPDPTSDIGVAGAQQYILEKVPAWVQKYGKKAAFFCTNDAQTEPLLRQVAKYGALFVEPDLPSPLMGYPGAFGIDLSKEKGNWPAILKKVEQVVVKAGAKARMGTWALFLRLRHDRDAGRIRQADRREKGEARQHEGPDGCLLEVHAGSQVEWQQLRRHGDRCQEEEFLPGLPGYLRFRQGLHGSHEREGSREVPEDQVRKTERESTVEAGGIFFPPGFFREPASLAIRRNHPC